MWIAINVEPETHVTDLVNQFQRRAIVISDLYNKLLAENKLGFRGVKKISISVTSIPDIDFVVGPIKGSPVAALRKTFDFKKLDSLSDQFFKMEILKLIQDSILELGNKFGWDTQGFNKIFEEILRTNFNHIYYELPMKTSPDKAFDAGVEVEMLEEGAQISIVFKDNSKPDDFLVLPMIMTHPNRIFVTQLVKKGKWLNSDRFQVTSHTGEIHFIGSRAVKKVNLEFTPKLKSEDQLIDDLLLASVATQRNLIIEIVKEHLNKRY